MLFVDIDGALVEFDIQKYVGKIDLFGNDAIRDMEYINNCVNYYLKKANENGDINEAKFIVKEVLPYVNNHLLERLKECRDCFLEYDNYRTKEEKIAYIEKYKQSGNELKIENREFILDYLKKKLTLSFEEIKKECNRAQEERRNPNLPFNLKNSNNDIIREDTNKVDHDFIRYKQPIIRAASALQRIKNTSYNNSNDDLIQTVEKIGDQQIVDYTRIYNPNHFVVNAKETLLETYQENLFSEMYALSHHTGDRESLCKIEMMNSEFPFITITEKSLIKFHTQEPKMNVRRDRSSKAKRAAEIIEEKTGIKSIVGTYLIDDSMENLENWVTNGGYAILYKPITPEELTNGIIQQPNDSRIFRVFSWNIEELRKAKDYFTKKEKVLQK